MNDIASYFFFTGSSLNRLFLKGTPTPKRALKWRRAMPNSHSMTVPSSGKVFTISRIVPASQISYFANF